MFFQARRTALLLVVAFLPAAAQQSRGSADGLPPRDEWQKVPEILAALGAAPGQRIADVAAGKGYLTKPLASAVGKTGRVYAVEIGAEELAALRTLSQQEGFTNIEVIAGSESDPHLPANLDGVVILNSYHELSDYKSTLAGIKRALRPGGAICAHRQRGRSRLVHRTKRSGKPPRARPKVCRRRAARGGVRDREAPR